LRRAWLERQRAGRRRGPLLSIVLILPLPPRRPSIGIERPEEPRHAFFTQVGGITRGESVAAVARAAFEFTEGVADLFVAVALPEVVKRTVQSAKRLNSTIGQRDRHALLTHMGFLPTPQPVTVRLSNRPSPKDPRGRARPAGVFQGADT